MKGGLGARGVNCALERRAMVAGFPGVLLCLYFLCLADGLLCEQSV